MANPIQTAADDLKRQLAEKVEAIKALPEMAEVLTLQQALNALEDVLKAQRTTLAEAFGLNKEVATAIRPDEFYGLSPLDAAKKYLKKRGEARPLSEIIEAIKSGGCSVGKADDLRTSLSRSTYEVAKVGEDLYGLVEFYKHLKRGGKKKNGGEDQGSATPDAPVDGGDSGTGNSGEGEEK